MNSPIRHIISVLSIVFCACTNALSQTTPLEYTGDAFLQPADKATAPGKIRALVIGISSYRELPKEAQLNFAHSDATNFYNFLTSQAGGNVAKGDIKLLLNEDATAAEIYAGLDWLLESQKNDRVIIFFAGHGDVENRTIKQRGFLLAHDSPRAGYHAGGTVKVIDLHDYLETLVSQNKANVLLITDACRAGKLAGGDTGQAQTTASLQEQWAGITKILSSQPGEKSRESEAWGGGYGVFTYHLLDGLKGLADKNADGFVSLSEVNQYLSNSVPQDTEDQQNPMVSGSLQIKLSQVDAAELAAVKTRKDLSSKNAPMVATRDNITKDTLNEITQKYYRSFRDAMNAKDYMTTPGKNALHFYRLIEAENKTNTAFVGDLRRALVAGLESKTQKVINRYMVNDKKLQEEEITQASVEMKTAVGLLSPSDIRYKTLEARRLFLENGFLYCICHNTKSSLEEANAALTKLRASLKLEPDAAYVYNSMGNVHYSRENYDSAKYFYLRASELSPKWSYPINNLGTLYATIGNKKEAIRYYEMAKAIDPDFGHIYNNIGNFYSNEKSIPYYEKALELDPDGAATYVYNMGIQYIYTKKEKQRAYGYFDRLTQYPVGEYYLWELCSILKDLGEDEKMHEYYFKAIDGYKKQIKQNPSESYLYHNLALLYSEFEMYYPVQDSLDRTEEFVSLVKSNYAKSIALKPEEPGSYISLANFYNTGLNDGSYMDRDSAIYLFKKGLDLNPVEKSYSLYSLANIYYDRNELDVALGYMEAALLVCDPEDTPGYTDFMGDILGYMEKYYDAITTKNEAISLGYEATAYDYNLMAEWALMIEDGGEGVYTSLATKRALKEKDNFELGKSYILQAQADMKASKPDAAIASLGKALKANPNFKERIEKREEFIPLHQNPKYKALMAKYKDK